MSKLNLICPQCGKSFGSQDARDHHMKSAHKNEFSCPQCNRKFKTKEGIEQHKRDVHGKVKCPNCNKEFKDAQSLNQHISSVHKSPCPHCSAILSSQQMLQKHILQTHMLEVNTTPKNQKLQKTKKPLKNQTPQNKNSADDEGIVVYRTPVLSNLLKKLKEKFPFNLPVKKVIILDECVGNNAAVIKELSDLYEVRPFPKELKGHVDRDIRLVCKEMRWGLVSKDRDMVKLAWKMRVRPVYFLTETGKKPVLIRISIRNYDVI